MRQLLAIVPTGHFLLDDVLNTELFVTARKLTAEPAPLVMQAKRAAQTLSEHAETLEDMNLQTEAKASAHKKEISALKAEHQLAVAEAKKLKTVGAARETTATHPASACAVGSGNGQAGRCIPERDRADAGANYTRAGRQRGAPNEGKT